MTINKTKDDRTATLVNIGEGGYTSVCMGWYVHFVPWLWVSKVIIWFQVWALHFVHTNKPIQIFHFKTLVQ